MTIQFFDPTGSGQESAQFAMAARFEVLQGLRCNILNNGKQNSDKLLSMVADLLKERYGVIMNRMVKKWKANAQATEDDLTKAVAGADFVLTGVGDCGFCSACSVQDGIEMERKGVPAVVICTEEFERTGKAISEMRGAKDYPFVVIPHPLGILDENKLSERAEQAVDRVVDLLVKQAAKA
jgi:hypothetical protein